MKYGLLVLCLIFSFNVSANCNFKSGEYIEKLSDPSKILFIEVQIPNSFKYHENAFKILSSNTQNIQPKLKKRFKARINVHYEFGICNYIGSVRQTGDWKDHINFDEGGKLLRSLDVRLKTGNILNATRFKLFIPETRKGINEVLGSLILGKLGFIVPETFEVNTLVNEVKHNMLFQETTSKELIERNLRRESAIFEGDENLLWSYKNYKNFELEPLSLSRLINNNWFKKGNSSREITLSAYSKLQKSYLEYVSTIDNENSLVIFPNELKSDIFPNYFFALISMNGSHALRPHNRKFFYNSITSVFEPIYYDGDISFNKILNFESDSSLQRMLLLAFKKPIDQSFSEKIEDINSDGEIRSEFIKRVNLKESEAIKFLNKQIKNLLYNKILFESYLSNINFLPRTSENSINYLLKNYKNLQSKKELKQKIIEKIDYKDGQFNAFFDLEENRLLSIDELAKILSKNKLNDDRVVLINLPKSSIKNNRKINDKNIFPGKIKYSPGVDIQILKDEKILKIYQSSSYDWLLIEKANLEGWKIEFKGLIESYKNIKNTSQRFNSFGLTGCLTIHDSNFTNSSIIIEGGSCEDGLNIINSRGSLLLIDIKNSFADALDIDFSTLQVSKLKVIDAGNDCLDVSGGNYFVHNAKLSKCGDKGISIGEKSIFKSHFAKVDKATIGLSSKDLSNVSFSEVLMDNVKICVEVKQKKQEFGGAFARINKLNCVGNIVVDNQSKLLKGDQ